MNHTLVKTFKHFISDETAWEMFITGQAGTGKTTSLAELVQLCVQLNIEYKVCAHTHKACKILASKLPKGAHVQTLWSYLRKRPSINDSATSLRHIDSSCVTGESEKVQLLFIDEFSMVGEEDLMDLRSLQDPEYEAIPGLKVVAIGDLNQLPPVKDMQTWVPKKPYWVKLNKIYRQKNGSQLIDTLTALSKMIEGTIEPEPLVTNNNFIRDLAQQELITEWTNDTSDKVFLCYTNEAVQNWNALLADKEYPTCGDLLFSPSAHRYYKYIATIPSTEIEYVDRLRDDILTFNSKYRTLEFLISSQLCEFYLVSDPEDEDQQFVFPVCWGTYNRKIQRNNLSLEAVQSNKVIEAKHGNAKIWSAANPKEVLARKRAKAWRSFLTFDELVVTMDFSHAMTVHKSQGSTFNNVYLDAQDLYKCANNNFTLYLKLYYVALSRAVNNVFTN